jgi:hypothetical protein
MRMRGTRLEKEVEICATNLASKTKWMSTDAKKRKTLCEDVKKSMFWVGFEPTVPAFETARPPLHSLFHKNCVPKGIPVSTRTRWR